MIAEAVKLIQAGELVAFPTETVYGLGANAFNEEACLKIYQAKGRPSNNPLIVHVASLEQAEELAIFNKEAYLLSKLWPGPLTMVLPRRNSSRLAECVTAGLSTVAIRVPAHRVARDLIIQSGVPIAAPSANKSGYLSPTSHRHVKAGFKSESVFVIDSETTTKYGLESTIIDLSTSVPTILRFGFITPQIIEQIIDRQVEIATQSSAIKAPGMMYTHYAPKTPIRINAISLEEGEIGLNFGGSKLNSKGSLNLSPTGDLAIAAANLFSYLHTLDDYARVNSLQRIAIAPIPNESIGLAINDRLIRATF
ncbi:MAG: threonylcarbamoyl-AMP synthase [Gammaproteobacteria bacterium]|nr:threonylcarbamoyl-AMP synthase [Gammaproteobacteria bacterium]